MDFKDKVVWITGASSGIGEHLAYAFAKNGAKLVLTARNEKALERVSLHCKTATPPLFFKMDVTNFEAIPNYTQKVVDHFGRIDILVNNAGISQRSLVIDTQLSVDQKIMNVNYLGVVAVTKAVLPFMIKQQSGQFVIISSLMGKFSTGLRSTYAASKHALHGFFDALRLETEKDNIKVTILCPGFVQTNVSINALTGTGEKTNKMDDVTAKGYTPEEFAHKALKAIKSEKSEILIGGKELLLIYIKRFFPRLLSVILKRVKTT